MILTLHPEFNFVTKVQNEQGIELVGLWQHGRTGGTHKSRLEFDSREGADYAFRTQASYHSGSKRSNNQKYLIAIIEL